MAKTPFNKKSIFTIKFELKFKEGTSKVLHSKYRLEWRSYLDTLESRLKMPGKF
jgi:hypothetical protein